MTYRILGIAPYEALSNTLKALGAGMENVHLDSYVGDLEQGVEIVRAHVQDQYDVIISRGGTARKIAEMTSIPVVDIQLSVYDVLRAMRLADNYQETYAIVGFQNITETAHILCDLLKNRTEIVTIHDEREAAEVLTRLKERGFRMVICDMVTQNYARRMELNSILITSGAESVMAALKQAVDICKSYAAVCEENRFLRGILKNNGASTVVMAEDGTVFLSTWQSKEDENEGVIEMLKKELKVILKGGDRKFFRSIDKTLYSVDTRTSTYNGQRYVLYYMTASKIPFTTGKYGIRFSSREEIEERYYNSFYSIAGAMGLLSEKIEEISQGKYPVMIEAEEGTGKELIAGYLYIKSRLSDHPLITVDCAIMDERGWEYLLNHYNSPFNDNDNTIYFENADRIPEDKHRRLLSAMLDTNLQRRNRLIFSANSAAGEDIRQRISDYTKKLYCVKIGMPPLRQRVQELPLLASFYLSKLNMDLGRQIIGLEPGAVTLLEQYSWPQNYKQFQRLLLEAASVTDTSYIRTDTIADLLEKEQAATVYNTVFSVGSTQPLPSMTLEQITENVIRRVLKDNDGNQSKTARQLGISRTTLWRYISNFK